MIYENNISIKNVDFSKIKKLKVIWSQKIKNDNDNNFEDYDDDGMIGTLKITEIDARYYFYGNTWGDAVFV